MAQRTVFISYAREDQPEVEASADLLRAGGVQVFIDIRDIDFGELWQEALRKALERCERVLVFWSLAARGSEWVEREWRTALSLGKRIVPMLLDATPLPSELQQFNALVRTRDRSSAPAPNEPTALAPTRSRPERARARSPIPAWAVGAGLLALLLAGSALWTLQRSEGPLPPDAPVVATPQPAPSPPSAQRPAPPNPDLIVSSDPLVLIQSLPALVLDARSDEVTLRRAAAYVGRLSEPGVIASLDPRALPDLAQAAEQSLARLQELHSMLENGQGSFATVDERQAFDVLLTQLSTAAPLLRRAAAAAPPQPPPVSPPHAEAPGSFWPWLLLLLLPLVGLIALRRRRVPDDAHRFVREVFEA